MQLLFENVENVPLDFSKPEEVQVVFEELYINDILSFIHSRSLEEHGNEYFHFVTIDNTIILCNIH